MPSNNFDPKWYKQHYSQQSGTTIENPAEHYEQFGQNDPNLQPNETAWEDYNNRFPDFDPEWYQQHYEQQSGNEIQNPRAHYTQYGQNDPNLRPNQKAWQEYRESDEWKKSHLESLGIPEGFDWQFYLQQNPDVQDEYGYSFEAAAQHYADWGKNEMRPINADQANNPAFISNQDIENPDLPPGTEYEPVLQDVTDEELLNGGDYTVDPDGASYTAETVDPVTAYTPGNVTAEQGTAVTADDAPTVDAATADVTTAESPNAGAAAQAEAYTVDPSSIPQIEAAIGKLREAAQVEAAQGGLSKETLDALRYAENLNAEAKLDKRATVQYQYKTLTDFPPGDIPPWARGAVKEAESRMAARGLGSSSIAGGAITGAVLKAALPIAQQDAQIFAAFENKKLDNQTQAVLTKAGFLADMDMKNLDNRQQAAVQNARNFLQMDLANLQNRQQAAVLNAQSQQQQILSNQAAINTAENLNVQETNRMRQFNADLDAQMARFNAGQANQTARFNADQQNRVGIANAQMQAETERFNVSQQNMMTQLNVQERNKVEMFNTELAANIDKFNTAQINTMSRFNAGENNAAARFNAEIKNMRDQFNVNNRRTIDQFNTQWQRQVNTQNTQIQNRANFTNAQNLLNISNSAISNSLMYLRDMNDFIFRASENDKDRAANHAIAMLNNTASMDRLMAQMDQESQNSFYSALGSFGMNIVSGVVEDTDLDIGSWFSGSESDYSFSDDFGTDVFNDDLFEEG